jgi:carbamoyltransferase
MWILAIQKQGIGSVCLLKDGEVVFHIMEERISRNKKFQYPFKAISKVKNYTSKIDKVIFTGYTLNKNHNQLLYSMLLNDNLIDENTGWVEYYHSHHLFHASNAFYNSGFKEALCIVWDGFGSSYELVNGSIALETTSVFNASYPANFIPIYKRFLLEERHLDSEADSDYNESTSIRTHVLKYPIDNCEIDFRNDLDIGGMYQCISRYILNQNECGKIMGLSAYGKQDDKIPQLMFGEFSNRNLFTNTFTINDRLYPNLHQNNLAYTLQKTIEDYGIKFVGKYLEKTGHKNLVISGGVGLNVCLNYQLKKNFPEINIYIEPNCEDSGNSVGACKIVWHSETKDTTIRRLTNCYMGELPSYNYKLINEKETDVTYDDVVDLIIQQNIIAIFQGRSEAGPRALGNRSILFDPRNKNGKDIVNTVKRREWYRPFAASVLKQECHNWFDMAGLDESPYMMYAVNVLPHQRIKIPSVVHVDGTCRIQTVTKEQNEHYYNIIENFNNKTGVPLLFNTSFNMAGEPLVETIEDAINTFRNSDINYLYLPEIGKIISK